MGMQRGIDLALLSWLSNTPQNQGMVARKLLGPAGLVRKMEDRTTFESQYKRISLSVDGNGKASKLFDLYLLLQVLIHREFLPNWFQGWLRDNINTSFLLESMKPAEALKGKWYQMPFVVVSGDTVRLRCLATGISRFSDTGKPMVRMPAWINNVMDHAAIKAIENAAMAALELRKIPEGHTLCLLPLLMPQGGVQVTGGSLGLATGLGFMQALHRQEISEACIASGNITSDGFVSRVEHLERKMMAAHLEQYRLFLHPPESFIPGSIDTSGMETVVVKNLDVAWALAELYRTEGSGRVGLFSAMLSHSRVFVNNCDIVPHLWLNHSREKGRLEDVVEETIHNPILTNILASRYMGCTERFELAKADALGGLLNNDRLEKASKKGPLAAFRWCTADISRRNHHGEIMGDQDFHVRLGKKLLPEIRKADLDGVLRFFNQLLVARHNRFMFSTELPPELHTLLIFMEEQNRRQSLFGCPVHIALGRMYGTLVQNSGFCGPGHLGEAEAFWIKALKTLGKNSVPEFSPEWLRQYSYITYAYLDAGEYEKAANSLKCYLQIDSWGELPEKYLSYSLISWQHALLSRCLAEGILEIPLSGYAEWVLSNRHITDKPVSRGENHPWELWAYNIGKLMQKRGDLDNAAWFYNRSLKVCLQTGAGPTIVSIALLPLASLAGIDQVPSNLKPIQGIIMNALNRLDPDHFARLRLSRFEDVLSRVQEKPSAFFPFSYR